MPALVHFPQSLEESLVLLPALLADLDMVPDDRESFRNRPSGECPLDEGVDLFHASVAVDVAWAYPEHRVGQLAPVVWGKGHHSLVPYILSYRSNAHLTSPSEMDTF